MEVIGADGVHIGTVDKVEEHRIKLTKADSGSHQDHHHYLSTGLIAAVEGNKIRLSANGASAVLLEEEAGGEAISDQSCFRLPSGVRSEERRVGKAGVSRCRVRRWP